MNPHRSILALVAAASVLAPAAAASAATTPITLGQGQSPGVAVDAAGTAYAAWRGPDQTGVGNPLLFCRLPKSATACDGGARTLSAPGSGDSQPFVFVSGTRVLVLQSRFLSSGGPAVYLLSSNDGGATFGPAQNVGNLGTLQDAVAGPGDTISFVTTYAVNLRFANISANAPAPAPRYANLSSPDDQRDLGVVGLHDGAPFVLLYDGFNGDAAWRRWKGSGDMNDEANWSAASTPGYLGEEPDLASGPLGLFAGGRQGPSSTRPVVRRFEGAGFAAPAVIEDTSANPSIAQDPGGRLHAAYGSSDRKHAYSDDGVSWKVETLVTGAQSASKPQIAAAADHSGVVVYWSSNTVSLARFGSTASAPAPSRKQVRKTLKVAGGTVTLTGPKGCVPPHESFYAKVTAKRLKILKVDFLIDGKRIARDTAAPFRQSLLQFDVPAGTSHTLTARGRIKPRHGKARAGSISAAFSYCAA
jgi:hypothetical protein